MIKIDKKIINNMVDIYNLENYLKIIINYEKEDELIRKKRNLVTQLEKTSSNFYNTNTIDTLIQIVNDIDNINNIEQLYIYEPDEVMYIFFNNSTFKNNIIINLFDWLENDQTKVKWIEANLFCLASNRKLYDKIFNINDNYFLSTINLNELTLNDIKC